MRLDAESEFPPRVVDPRTNRIYVLVEAEQYERMRALLEEELDIRAAYPLMDAVAASEGWDDPSMDIYNHGGNRNLRQSLGNSSSMSTD